MQKKTATSLDLLEFISEYQKKIQPLFKKKPWFSLESENLVLEKMKHFFLTEKNPFERKNLSGHFTASSLIFNPKTEKIILTHHRKLDKWLQLGGHCDGIEDLLIPAMQEAKEESGLKNIRFSPLSKFKEIPLPIDFDIHVIPARQNEPEHLHLDVRFLLETNEENLNISHESLALKWFSTKEVRQLSTEENLLRLLDKFEFLNSLQKKSTPMQLQEPS